MGGKVMIGGTAHNIVRGFAKIGGTTKKILKGRTRIDGVNYDIKFPPNVGTMWSYTSPGTFEWVCPYSGSYSIELHGRGGGGGFYAYGPGDYSYYAGGGSGQLETVKLIGGTKYTIEIPGKGALPEPGYVNYYVPGESAYVKSGGTVIVECPGGIYSVRGRNDGGGPGGGNIGGKGVPGQYGHGGYGNVNNPSQKYGNGGFGGQDGYPISSGEPGAFFITYVGD